MEIDRKRYFIVFLAKSANEALGHISYATRDAAKAGLDVAKDYFPDSWMKRVQDEDAFA